MVGQGWLLTATTVSLGNGKKTLGPSRPQPSCQWGVHPRVPWGHCEGECGDKGTVGKGQTQPPAWTMGMEEGTALIPDPSSLCPHS